MGVIPHVNCIKNNKKYNNNMKLLIDGERIKLNHPSNYLNRPVFISGYHKSGTTLFLSILDGHPELVVIPEELNFFKSVLYEEDKAKAIREQSGFKMFLSNQGLPEWEHWRTWYREGYPEFNHKQFNQSFEKAVEDSESFKDLLIQMVNAFAEVDHVDPTTKSRWVSKTPMEEIYFPVMMKMFGKECKFIYIVRDPRDVYTSISKWKVNQGKETMQGLNSVVRFCVYWQTRLQKVIRYQENFENVCVFRFEDLLQNTENTLRQLCEFLQIEFTADLLQPTRHGKQWGGNSVYTEEFKGLSDEPVGRFQKILDPRTRSIIEHLLYKELVSFGYMNSDSIQADKAEKPLVPWRYYWTTLGKFQIKYFFNQSYIRLRYNFKQLH